MSDTNSLIGRETLGIKFHSAIDSVVNNLGADPILLPSSSDKYDQFKDVLADIARRAVEILTNQRFELAGVGDSASVTYDFDSKTYDLIFQVNEGGEAITVTETGLDRSELNMYAEFIVGNAEAESLNERLMLSSVAGYKFVYDVDFGTYSVFQTDAYIAFDAFQQGMSLEQASSLADVIIRKEGIQPERINGTFA